jgi:hypothetical protein
MFQLEKYSGSKSRHVCPNCGAKREFARYVDDSGDYLSDEVGKCNRDSKCGYHFTPRQFFADNPNKAKQSLNLKSAARASHAPKNRLPAIDFIEKSFLLDSLSGYEQNSFIQFLATLFDEKTVADALERYLIGTWADGRAVFWQIDRKKRIRTGKLIAYDQSTGKRLKDKQPSFVHAELKRAKKLPPDFALKQCFFGEHLLADDAGKPVAVVESAKTAIIASVFFPEFVWLSSEGKLNQLVEKLGSACRRRKVVLFPDADGFERWRADASEANRLGLNVTVSDLLEKSASLEEKQNGFDLADFLIEEAGKINGHNSFVDFYNERLEKVLRDENLLTEVETIVNERAAILICDGLKETEAYEVTLEAESLRRIVLNLAREQIDALDIGKIC